MPESRLRVPPMRVQVLSGSVAERQYAQDVAASAWTTPAALARGLRADHEEDLVYRGGRLVPKMEYQNIYLGTAAWRGRDAELIDAAILRAMRERRLNHVLAQYFPGSRLDCAPRDSLLVEHSPKHSVSEADVQAAVTALYDQKLIRRSGLDACVFNLMLAPGMTLKLGRSSSTAGLGGFHGSVHVQRGGKRVTLYYSANVYSDKLPDGRDNGIIAFDQPWKNVVATLYHELNEFRTDPDVADAIGNENEAHLGWTSDSGAEIGDQPIFAAGDLGDLRSVFKEVLAGGKRTPVQLMYSNAVHGAEGPIAMPRP